MAEIYVNDQGEASMQDPDSGEYRWVPKQEYGDALAAGYTPESPESWQKRQIAKNYEDRGVAAALAGAARGATFGLSDAVLPHVFTDTDFKALKEHNEAASIGGDIAGTVASALIPGGAVGTLSRGAAKAGAKVAASAAKRGALSKAAGAVTTSAIEGAAIGAGKGISDVALNKGDVEIQDAVSHVLKEGVTGMAFGAGLGAAGQVIAKAGSSATKRFIPDIKGLSQKRAQQKLLESELKIARQSGMPSSRVKDLEKWHARVTKEYTAKRGEVAHLLTKKSMGTKVISAALGSPTKAASILVTPKLSTAARKFFQPAIAKGKDKAKDAVKSMVRGKPAVEQAIERASGKSVDKAIDAAFAGKGALRKMGGDVAADVLADTVYPKAAQMARTLEPSVAFSKKLLKTSAMAGGVEALSRDDIRGIAEGIHEIDEDAFAPTSGMAIKHGVPVEEAQAMTQAGLGVVQFLQEKSPIKPDAPTEQVNPMKAQRQPTTGELQRYERYVQAARDPEHVFDLVAKGRVSMEHLETLERVYPDLHGELRRMAQQQVDMAIATGGTFSRKQQRTLTMLMHGKRHARHAKTLQQFYQVDQQQKIKQRNVKIDMANKAASRAQKTLERL